MCPSFLTGAAAYTGAVRLASLPASSGRAPRWFRSGWDSSTRSSFGTTLQATQQQGSSGRSRQHKVRRLLLLLLLLATTASRSL